MLQGQQWKLHYIDLSEATDSQIMDLLFFQQRGIQLLL